MEDNNDNEEEEESVHQGLEKQVGYELDRVSVVQVNDFSIQNSLQLNLPSSSSF